MNETLRKLIVEFLHGYFSEELNCDDPIEDRNFALGFSACLYMLHDAALREGKPATAMLEEESTIAAATYLDFVLASISQIRAAQLRTSRQL